MLHREFVVGAKRTPCLLARGSRGFRTSATASSRKEPALPVNNEKESSAGVEISSFDDDDRVFAELTVDTFAEIITSDDDREFVQSVLDDYEYQKYTTYRVPCDIPLRRMREMMELKLKPNFKKREVLSYFEYLFQVEMANRREDRKKLEKRRVYEEMKAARGPSTEPGVLFDADNKPIYATFHNSFISWLPGEDRRHMTSLF